MDLTTVEVQDDGVEVSPKIKIKIKIKIKPTVKVNKVNIVDDKTDVDLKDVDDIDDITFKPISLEAYQQRHVENLSRIFSFYPVAMDFSMLGSGKTYTSSYFSMHSDLNFKHVVVICPLSLITKWTHMKTYHGVPICTIDTYNSVRTVKCSQPTNGLLKRLDYKQQVRDEKTNMLKNIDKVEFAPTLKFKNLIKDGVLLIIDEFQHIKNITAQFLACQALIKTIITESYTYDNVTLPINNSRVLLMSGSPIDKVEQVLNIYRLIGVMKIDRLSQYNPFTGTNEWKGFMDVFNMSNAMNTYEDEIIKYDNGIFFPQVNTGSAQTFTRVSYTIFQHLLKRTISSSMKMTENPFNVYKFNGFYHIYNEEDALLMTEGVGSLSSAANFDGENVNFGTNGAAALTAITSSLQKIETAKISAFVRVASIHLTLNKNAKVVICLNYTLTVADIAEQLKQFNPLIMTGKTNTVERGKLIAKFNQDDDDHRVLIANLKVCSSGIDLDDKFGTRPRFCLISPNYSSIDLYQVSHRFIRMNSKSDATVHMIYAAHCSELSILTALAKKSTVMKQTTNVQAETGVVFPCDYPRFDEIDLRYRL